MIERNLDSAQIDITVAELLGLGVVNLGIASEIGYQHQLTIQRVMHH